jgi:histidinol dehydrogenase
MLTRLDTSARDFEERLEELRKKLSPDGTVVSERSAQLTMSLFGEAISPQQVVERICREVRIQGTQAVLKYARALDDPRMDASRLRVPSERMVEAHKAVAPEFLQAVRAIRNNIARFQQAILHQDVELTDGLGQVLKQRYRPLERIGICVPGGAAAYPSTVLMTAIPAQIAGVKQIAIMAPPTPFGAYNPEVLATCYELGIQEVYAVGGAQGIASLAYGIPEIPAVDMIVGPGNLFVALAKRLVYGTVAIDSIAGPSEVVVIADRTTKPPNAASDLIAQAEHSPGSSIVLSSDSKMLDQIDEQIQLQLTRLERAELAKDSLIKFGASILCDSEQEVVRICDRLAPEHLQISVDEPDRYSSQIRNAGAIFKGHYSPVALGDYAAGPSHVLPTGGTARWASGLSANHFLRSYSEVEFTLDGLRAIEPHVTQLADKEGLTAHRQSVKIRLD